MIHAFDDIDRILAEHADFADASAGVSEATIRAAEAYLEVRFSVSYSEFLRKWGTLSFGPIEYYGLIDSEFVHSGIPDAAWYTQKLRQDVALPKHLVILVDNDGDEYYCLDTSTFDSRGECPVVVWDCPSAAVSRIKGDNFAEFLLQNIKDFIA
ncbi:MAG TPA: SMI1/KNR4 family protein [Telluria sp.]|jgi:hypothetical protein